MTWVQATLSVADLAVIVEPKILTALNGSRQIYIDPSPAAVPLDIYLDAGNPAPRQWPGWTGATAGAGFPPNNGPAFTLIPGQPMRFKTPQNNIAVRPSIWSGYMSQLPQAPFPVDVTSSVVWNGTQNSAAETMMCGRSAVVTIQSSNDPSDAIWDGTSAQDRVTSLTLIPMANQSNSALLPGWTGTTSYSGNVMGPDQIVMPGVARRFKRMRLIVQSVEAAFTLSGSSFSGHLITLVGRPFSNASGSSLGRTLYWGSNDANTCRFEIDLGSPSDWMDSLSGYISTIGGYIVTTNGVAGTSRQLSMQLVLDQGDPQPGRVRSRMVFDAATWALNSYHAAVIPTSLDGSTSTFQTWLSNDGGAHYRWRRNSSSYNTTLGATQIQSLDTGGQGVATYGVTYGLAGGGERVETHPSAGAFAYLIRVGAVSVISPAAGGIMSHGAGL